MKQLIPFHKEILFKTMIGEITSISLEHDIALKNDSTLEGSFIISGSYKMTEASQIEEEFLYKIPVDISIDDQYDAKKCKIDIDDFYYEILNEEILKVHIDVIIEGLEEKQNNKMEKNSILLNEDEIEKMRFNDNEIEKEKLLDDIDENLDFVNKEKDINYNQIESKPTLNLNRNDINDSEAKEVLPSQPIGSIFSAFRDTEETFKTYSVYIVRENDTLDSILERYNITKEELAKYNNLDQFSLGVKLVIPCSTKNE